MVKKTLTMETKFPGLNAVIDAAKRSPKGYATMKKEYTRLVIRALIQGNCVPKSPYKHVTVNYTFYEKGSAERDPDNILSTFCKFFLDGMVETGVIDDDNIYIVSYGGIRFIPGAPDYKVEVSWDVE